jgi:xylan 1,4-beta-xylosidase
MKKSLLLILLVVTLASSVGAGSKPVRVTVSLDKRIGPMEIDKFALGQGGLSPEPMWDSRIAEVRALRPRIIRIFLQEYFDLLPEPGNYRFEILDRSIDAILKTGAKPLMCICFKPKVLFPQIDQDIVEPNDYSAWEDLIFHLVRHYRRRGAGIRHWEVANEPDIGEDGGCPYRFEPDSYVRYYQHTAEAILHADPNASVGGPALANVRSPILPALLEAASAAPNHTPLHFISWHIYSSDPKAIGGTIDYAKGLLERHPDLQPETFLDEWNLNLGFPPSDPRIQPCYVAEVAWQMKARGLDYSCYYHIRDYHVTFERFAEFMSPVGTAFMEGWWNRMPQFDGLFDFQNNVRPAYFTFKLLSRLTGDRLQLTTDHPTIHGFASRDDRYSSYQFNLMLWNFSPSQEEVEVTFQDVPNNITAKPVILDATAPSIDEIARLRPERPLAINCERPSMPVKFDPYQIRFWSLELER